MLRRFSTVLGLYLNLTIAALGAVPQSVIIEDDMGGLVTEYNKRWQQYEASGQQVVIAGSCASACARFMTLKHICATDQGYFYFHALRYENGEVDYQGGIADSQRWESPRSVELQRKYDAFSFTKVTSRPALMVPTKDRGVWIVYWRTTKSPDSAPVYEKLLRVKATLLVPRCRR